VPRQQAGSQAGGAEAGVQVARSACHGQDKRGHDWPVATYRWRDRIGQQEPFGQGRIGGVAYDFFFFFFFFPTSAVRLCPTLLVLAPSGQRQSRARCPMTGGSYVSASIRLSLVITRLTSKLRKGHNNATC